MMRFPRNEFSQFCEETFSARFHEQKGPYSILIYPMMADPIPGHPLVARIDGIRLIRDGKVLYERNEAVDVPMDRVSMIRDGKIFEHVEEDAVSKDPARGQPGRRIASGFSSVRLDDVLDPRDGKYVQIELWVRMKDGRLRILLFDFRPKVERGNFDLMVTA